MEAATCAGKVYYMSTMLDNRGNQAKLSQPCKEDQHEYAFSEALVR